MSAFQRFMLFILLCFTGLQIAAAVAVVPAPPGDTAVFIVYSLSAAALVFLAILLGSRIFIRIITGRRNASWETPRVSALSCFSIVFFYFFTAVRLSGLLALWSRGWKIPSIIAIAVLSIATGFVAYRVEKSTGKHSNVSKRTAREIFAIVILSIIFPLCHYHMCVYGLKSPAATGESVPPDQQSALPHVVLVTIDTLGSFHTDFYSDRGTTPALLEIASEGAAFPDTVSPIPLTGPSHASILTGAPPQVHGVLNNGGILPGEFETLAEKLSDAGYHTAAVVNSPFVGSRYNFDQGFDVFHERWRAESPLRHLLLRTTLFRFIDVMSKFCYYRDLHPLPGFENMWKARMIIENHDGKPLFLWYHTFLPHTPYAPPGPVKDMFGASGVPDWKTKEFKKQMDDGVMLEPGRLKKVRALYYGDVFMADRAVAMINGWLGKNGMSENTLLVITADHGETFQRHSSFIGHAREVYEDTIRVPLVFRWPEKIQKTGASAGTARLTDVVSTVLDLIGLPVPGDSVGTSLAPMQADSSAKHHEPDRFVSETIPPQGVTYKLAVRKAGFKIIRDFEANTVELYDMDLDPYESRNLAVNPAFSRELEMMEKEADRWMKHVQPRMKADTRNMACDTAEELKDLGYLK